MIEIKVDNPTLVAKRAFWLAWQACGSPFGMGVLQDNSEADEDAVWLNVIGATDHPGGGPWTSPHEPYADYVFGRMMKLGIVIGSDFLEVRDTDVEIDYQAWYCRYPTYRALIEAAITDLQTVEE